MKGIELINELRKEKSLYSVVLEIEMLRVTRPGKDHQYRLEAARIFPLLGIDSRAKYDKLIKEELIFRLKKSLEYKYIDLETKSNDWLLNELINLTHLIELSSK